MRVRKGTWFQCSSFPAQFPAPGVYRIRAHGKQVGRPARGATPGRRVTSTRAGTRLHQSGDWWFGSRVGGGLSGSARGGNQLAEVLQSSFVGPGVSSCARVFPQLFSGTCEVSQASSSTICAVSGRNPGSYCMNHVYACTWSAKWAFSSAPSAVRIFDTSREARPDRAHDDRTPRARFQ
jgi:hypothetical protein